MFPLNPKRNQTHPMDINFICTSCNQELSADESMAGYEIECPACQSTIAIPGGEAAPAAAAPAPTSSPDSGAPRMAIQLQSGSTPSELIKKSQARRLSVAAKAELKVYCKTLLRGEFDTNDAFDKATSEFLSSGDYTIREIHPIQSNGDYGLLVIYDK